MLHDPVCGRRINRNQAYARVTHERVTYYLCCPICQAQFATAPGGVSRAVRAQPEALVVRLAYDPEACLGYNCPLQREKAARQAEPPVS